MSPAPHPQIFLGAVVILQGFLALWTYRTSGSTPFALLVALLPFVGLPYLLWTLRSRLQDNHIAGAATYLILLGASIAFSLLKSGDEVPWMVIHTMSLFGFLGVANLTATRLRD